MDERATNKQHKNIAVVHGCVMTLFSPSPNGTRLLVVTTTSLVRAKEIKIDHKILINTKAIDGRDAPKPGTYIAVEGPLTEHGLILAESYYNASDLFHSSGDQSPIKSKNYITLYGTISDPPTPFRHGQLFTMKTETTSNGATIRATHLVMATETYAQKLSTLRRGDYVWVEGPMSIDKKVILSHLSVNENHQNEDSSPQTMDIRAGKQ